MATVKYGYTDRPVSNIKEDSFKMETYINGLCSFIRNCETPMTISIQGAWGSGKTSMMNMIRENLQSTICPVWFNTWQFSQFDMGNTLVFSMMDILLTSLDCEEDAKSAILGSIKGFAKTLAVATTERLAGSETAAAVREEMAGSTQNNYAVGIMDLKKQFQLAVNKKTKAEHKDRVVVFIDDLDRLQPEKAIELLEVLKLFLDCEKCVFVLAVDYEVVTLGIKKKYGSDVDEVKGKSFFDKIIQLPFKIPVAQYDISNYVKNMMKKTATEITPKNVALYEKLIRNSIGFNPRSMKRLFNTYQLLDIITRSTILDTEIDQTVRQRVLFAIICMQMEFEGLYQYMASLDTIEPEMIDCFKNTKTLQEELADTLFHGESEDNKEKKSQRIVGFMKYFVEALQIDDDNELSAKEIENLSTILKCSMVTSVGSEQRAEKDDTEYAYRTFNHDLAVEVKNYLKEIGEFSFWLPRKPRAGVRFSDVCAYTTLHSKNGLEFTFEYYLVRENAYTVTVNLILHNRTKRSGQGFYECLGANPLRMPRGVWSEGNNRLDYASVISVASRDRSIAEQIASAVKNAYANLSDYLA